MIYILVEMEFSYKKNEEWIKKIKVINVMVFYQKCWFEKIRKAINYTFISGTYLTPFTARKELQAHSV